MLGAIFLAEMAAGLPLINKEPKVETQGISRYLLHLMCKCWSCCSPDAPPTPNYGSP